MGAGPEAWRWGVIRASRASTSTLLRHTAGSLMASFGMDPASAAERLGHTDGGALFLRTYRHLYEGEKRAQAERFGARVQAALDEEWTESPAGPENGVDSGDSEWAHLGLNQGPLACEASALPLSYAPGMPTRIAALVRCFSPVALGGELAVP